MSTPPPPPLASLRAKLRAVGVTGTNGKTTTTSMVAAVVAASGELDARVTSLGTWVGDTQLSTNVSLEAFHHAVHQAVARGVHTIAVETTSKSLASGFAQAWPADVAVFTNLTRDHLDVHGSPEAYLAAKAQLFITVPAAGTVVWNLADPCSALLDEVSPPEATRRGWVVGEAHPDCAALPLHLRATDVRTTTDGTRFEVSASPGFEHLGGAYQLGAVGAVHVQNALGAMLAADALGYRPEAIRSGLRRFAGVPGRFEVVGRRPSVVVDYAHTPDALERTLAEARRLVGAGGKLICVFGCGGGRDRGKRPEMARSADVGADRVWLTSDNPRQEEPGVILDEVEAGVVQTDRQASWLREADRRAAITSAIAQASDADVVVIAGRGDETHQILADGSVPLSDRAVAKEALSARQGGVQGD